MSYSSFITCSDVSLLFSCLHLFCAMAFPLLVHMSLRVFLLPLVSRTLFPFSLDVDGSNIVPLLRKMSQKMFSFYFVKKLQPSVEVFVWAPPCFPTASMSILTSWQQKVWRMSHVLEMHRLDDCLTSASKQEALNIHALQVLLYEILLRWKKSA